MRKTISCASWLLALWVLLGGSAGSAQAARIEAIKGKTYRLTKEHGPWMVMVTSLRGDTAEKKKNATQAAHDLVLELRRKGIPAYIYSQEGNLAEIDSFDRRGNIKHSFVAEDRDRICIVAGNYPSIDDKVAQQTLKYIKQLQPKSLENGVYRKTPGRPGPLSRAFLTLNPLFSRDEIREKTRKRDPLLLKLNTGGDYNLLENQGKYTLIVASFYGKSQTHLLNPGQTAEPEKFKKFDRQLETSSSLDQAGFSSWELAKAMRAQNIEAFVFHERYRSIVTVGSFDSPQDPRLVKLVKNFSAKQDRDPESGREFLRCEAIQIKGNSPNGPPLRNWIMDPVPELIEVPKLR